jgi:Mg-chelatase subunit ChlD
MLRRLWFPGLAFLAFCAALTGLSLDSGAAPAPIAKKPYVEVVFCLDTTGSMGGLIEGAKQKIWLICNQILNGRPTPKLRIGLVAFKDKGDVYITKVFDMTDDLDAVYGEMKTYTAEGGGDTPESVNQALDDAINKIKWSKDKKVMRLVFLVGDAPPHMDYTDDVKYPVTCKKAMDLGIVINTIQCGNDADCTKYWKDIAEKGGGSYAAIPQAGGIVTLATPHDRRLAEINTELAKTILVWGSATKKAADRKKASEAVSMPAHMAADRICSYCKEGKTATYDLLDSIRAGLVRLESMKADDLPTEMQKMSLKERRDHLDKISRDRSKLIKEAQDLDRKRNQAIADLLAKNKASFDNQAIEMLRKQAKKFRIKY